MATVNRGTALVAAGGVAVLGTLAWVLFGPRDKPQAQARPPFVIPVTLAQVEAREVVPWVRLTGTVRAVRRAELGFEVAGIVSEVQALEGDQVQRGQLLAQLDGREQACDEQVRAAELALAQRELEKLQAGERVEDVRRLEGELEVARANLSLAQLEVERGRSLLENKVISRADLDRLTAAQQAAAGKLQSAQEALALAQAGARVEDIGRASAQVDRARAELAHAHLDLERTRLRAPWDGVVVQRQVSVGDYAQAGKTAYELVDPDDVEVVFEIPSAYGQRLGASPVARLRVDELPDFELEAPVTHRIPVADASTRNYTGIVRLSREQHQDQLEPGLYVRLELRLAAVGGHPVVPSDAVLRTDKGFVVARAKAADDPQSPTPFVAELVPVRVLGADEHGSAVQVLGEGTLSAGDQVVVTGVDRMFPGAALSPQGGAPAAAAPAGDSGAGD